MKINQKMKTTMSLAAAMGAFALTANAATIVPITDFSAHGGGDEYAATLPSLIEYGTLDDRSLYGTPETNNLDQSSSDPADWTYTGSDYWGEWFFHDLRDNGGAGLNPTINNKMGWVTIDLGSVKSDLDLLYIFNNVAPTGPLSYNVYHATSTTLPTTPTDNAYGSDIDFTSGSTDWTFLANDTNTAGHEIDTFNLSSISARYIGVEIMTGGGDSQGRVGFDEIAVTAVPEPTTTALLGLGGFALILRRRK
jgi:hypothetical protein